MIPAGVGCRVWLGVAECLLWAVGEDWSSVSQPPDRGPVPIPGINYTGPREA